MANAVIERVARALWANATVREPQAEAEFWIGQARVAIGTLRVPTEEMLDSLEVPVGVDGGQWREYARNDWIVMIDGLLAGG